MMKDIMPPIFSGSCWIPTTGRETDKFAIEERIVKVKSDVVADKQIMEWFRDFLVEFPTNQHPLEFEQVAEKQSNIA